MKKAVSINTVRLEQIKQLETRFNNLKEHL